MTQLNWEEQKLCTDIGDYELIIEKQKKNWECDQKLESWKWMVVYHGSVVASGSTNDLEDAKVKAEANVPQSADANENSKDCADSSKDE